MQKDFIDGSLGCAEAQAIIPACVEKIKSFNGDIFVTLDTHYENYLNTAEGKKLPVIHCIKGTDGWALDKRIAAALEGKDYTTVEKNGFGSVELPGVISRKTGSDALHIQLMGRCTDICVASNALILKSAFPEAEMDVYASCCAGVSVQTHQAALDTMRCCQINIL